MDFPVLISAENISNGGFVFDVLDLGLVDYGRCVSLQQSLSEDIFLSRKPSTLILCEHNPVITLGRQGSKNNILRPLDEIESRGISIASVNRGGDVTLHLPGQLVAYPVFDLRLLGRDISRFLRNLENAAVSLLKDYGIEAKNRQGLTGVWVGGKKIASIGIAISHWVSTHGLALNVACDLDLFSLIKPCGQDIIMTSMAEWAAPGTLKMDGMKKRLVDKFLEVFLRAEDKDD